MKLILATVFEADVAEISVKLAVEATPEIAERWEADLAAALARLLEWPELGRVRRELHPAGIRSWGLKEFPNYLLFYHVQGEELTALRVRYGGMSLPELFSG